MSDAAVPFDSLPRDIQLGFIDSLKILGEAVNEARVQTVLDKVYELSPTARIPGKIQRAAKHAGPIGGGLMLYTWAIGWLHQYAEKRGDTEFLAELEPLMDSMAEAMEGIAPIIERYFPPPAVAWVNPERCRTYRITVDYASSLLAEQRHACAICETPFANPAEIRYDHNHATGTFRGFLCLTCNTGLGHLQDNPRVVANALRYLNTRGHYGTDPQEQA